jgi:hypothetical protein
MVIVYLVTAFLGAFITFAALLWHYGVTIALLGMPFGASLLMLIVAVLTYLRGSGEAVSRSDHTVYKDLPQELQNLRDRQSAPSELEAPTLRAES